MLSRAVCSALAIALLSCDGGLPVPPDVEPGIVGRWFVRTLEPPVRPGWKLKAPKKIVPRKGPSLADAFAEFLASQAEVRAFLSEFAGIDLASVRFPNPFIRGIRFSLATGLHVITSHERRHLWQARRVFESLSSWSIDI